MKTLKKRIGLIFLLLAVFSYYGYTICISKQPISHPVSHDASAPDHRFTKLMLKRFDANGQLTQHLDTPYLQHAPFDKTYWLKTPHINLTDTHQSSWQIHAREAVSHEGTQKIVFKNNVEIYKKAQANQPTITIMADEVRYFPTQHESLCLGHVKLDQHPTHVRAATARAIMNAQNQLILATIKGNASRQAHVWTTTDPQKPILHAHADVIRYRPQQHLLELTGHAIITQGQQTFSAPIIRYDTKKKRLITHAEGTERTTIILPSTMTNNIGQS